MLFLLLFQLRKYSDSSGAVVLERGAAGIARAGTLDLHHVGAEPGERLRAGGAGLVLRQIEDAHSVERGHEVSFRGAWKEQYRTAPPRLRGSASDARGCEAPSPRSGFQVWSGSKTVIASTAIGVSSPRSFSKTIPQWFTTKVMIPELP